MEKPPLGKKPLLSTNISPTGWLVSKGVHFFFSLPQLHTCIIMIDNIDLHTCIIMMDNIDLHTCIIMIDNIDSHTCTCKICTFFPLSEHTPHMHTPHMHAHTTQCTFFPGWVGGILTTFSQGGKLRMTAPVMHTRSYSRALRRVWRQDISFHLSYLADGKRHNLRVCNILNVLWKDLILQPKIVWLVILQTCLPRATQGAPSHLRRI